MVMGWAIFYLLSFCSIGYQQLRTAATPPDDNETRSLRYATNTSPFRIVMSHATRTLPSTRPDHCQTHTCRRYSTIR